LPQNVKKHVGITTTTTTNKQQQQHDSDLRQGESTPNPESWSGIASGSWGRIRDTGSRWLPKIHLWWNFPKEPINFFSEMWAKLWKNTVYCNVDEPFKTFLDPYPEADEFQYLIASPLSLANVLQRSDK